jgi:hypothetical protein
MSGNNILKIVFIALLIIISVLCCGCLREYDVTDLEINKVDISAEVIDEDIVQLNIITYVSNSGKSSGKVDIQAKAYNLDTGLLSADQQVSLDKVEIDKTVNATVPLLVPITDDYRIEVILYENEGQITSGSATISGLESLLSQPKHSYINIRDVDVRMLNRSDSTTTLKITTFLDNYGISDSSSLTELVKLRDAKSNLIGNSGNINVGVIKADTTVVKDIELTVPKDRDYQVEVMIFENDRIIVEYGVSCYMDPDSTGPKTITKESTSTSTTKTVTTEFIESEPEPEEIDDDVYRTEYGIVEEEPGFGVFSLLFCMAIVIIFLRKRKK